MKQGDCVSARGSSMFKGPEAERSSSPHPEEEPSPLSSLSPGFHMALLSRALQLLSSSE